MGAALKDARRLHESTQVTLGEPNKSAGKAKKERATNKTYVQRLVEALWQHVACRA